MFNHNTCGRFIDDELFQISIVPQATANNQQPTANNQQPTTNNQQPTANNQHPTTNNQQGCM
jgi:hypothetical protein